MRAALVRAIERSANLNCKRQCLARQACGRVEAPPEQGQALAISSEAKSAWNPTDANLVASVLLVEHMDTLEKMCDRSWVDMGGQPFGTAGPRVNIVPAAMAARVGQPVDEVLRLRAQLLCVENHRKSLASIASGLRAWHEFATTVLRYESEHSLPPVDENHVAMFVSIFHCSGTAGNYVGHIRWACRELGLTSAWGTSRVASSLGGLKN